MKFKKGITTYLLLVLSVFILTSCGPKKVELGFNVKPGEKYKVQQSIEQKIVQTLEGQSLDSNQNIKMGYTYDVTAVDDKGVATITTTFDSVSVTITGNGENLQYDSTKAETSNDPLVTVYGGIIGKSLTIRIDKQGNVLELQGVDKLMGDLINNLNIENPQEKQQLLQALEQNFGDEALKESFSKVTKVYPPANTKVGDSWEDTQTLNMGYPITIINKYTLKEEQGDFLTIDMNSDIKTSSAEPMDMMGIRARYDLSGNQTGSFRLNKNSGIAESGNSTQKMAGSIVFEPSDLAPQGLTMPITIDAKTNFEMKKQ
ncbi:DUF6263 family protein [Clostridium sp. UBA4548]|uniref:DUF6263 family protein n=1 Tax=Clostridium sp. UBA4548 TaxID=1946361 RepID=UPI0025B98054|nr:DUF6263 family protein [Clostridium sp. UBA4548]